VPILTDLRQSRIEAADPLYVAAKHAMDDVAHWDVFEAIAHERRRELTDHTRTDRIRYQMTHFEVGDNTAIDANLTAASPGAGAAYGEQSFNGYQLFADLQQVLGHGAFMSAMQALHAGAEPRSGVEVLSLFRNSTSNPAAVDALYQRSVQNYAEVSAAVRA